MSLENWTFSDSSAGEVPYGELVYKESHHESGEEVYGDNASATRVFFVDWDQRQPFVDALLGWAYRSYPGVARILADEHPELGHFFAVNAKVKPKGQSSVDGVKSNWTIAQVMAEYKPVDYAVLRDNEVSSEMDRYTSRRYGMTADYLTLNSAMKFVTSGRVLSAAPGIVVPSEEIKYIWRQVPADVAEPFLIPTRTQIATCQGKTNSSVFDGYAAGTLLFSHVEASMTMPRLEDGFYYWEIIYTMIHRDNGAGIGGERAGVNYIFDTSNNRWDLATHDGTAGGVRIYQNSDLNALFELA